MSSLVITLGIFFAGLAGWLLAITLWLDLRARDRKDAWARDDRATAAAFDPGPLDDSKLREVLRGKPVTDGTYLYAFCASRTLDRVQDAFERLMREKAARGKWLS